MQMPFYLEIIKRSSINDKFIALNHLYVGKVVDNFVCSLSSFHLAVIVFHWVKNFTPFLP